LQKSLEQVRGRVSIATGCQWRFDADLRDKTMKTKLIGLLTGVLTLGAAGAASAADMATKAPPPPIVVPVYNWTGFYVGLNGGWGNSHNCWDYLVLAAPVFSDGCRDRSGGLFGGQIGYRWQSNQFVFGLEAQGDWADLSSSRISVFNPTLSTRVRTDGIGLFTAQLGWAWNAALLYVKGGAAVTSNRFDIYDTPTGIGLASASATRWGGALGVGFEYGFTPNWSIGVEYDHLWMGTANNTFTAVDPRLVNILNNRVGQDVDMFTLRLNYRFGGYAAPVTARY
jgi:outer membrane immunogenic protein